MNAFEWDMAKAHMTAYWGAEVETRLADSRSSGMWFRKLERFEYVDIAAGIDELADGHAHMPTISQLREKTIEMRRTRVKDVPSIAGPNGGAREWEMEKIAEAEKYAAEFPVDDDWLGRRVAAIRTDGPFTERVKALEAGDDTSFAQWWAETFAEPDERAGGMPERIGDIIRRGRA